MATKWAQMDTPAREAWGDAENAARKADLAEVHAGTLSLRDAQDRATARRRAISVTGWAATNAVVLSNRRKRLAEARA